MDSSPDTDQNARMRGLFTRIAGMYDRLNRTLSLGIDVSWRKRALARLERCARYGGDRPLQVLDLATGTADVAIATASRYPRARITGIDLTPAMLAVGREKVAARGLSGRVTLREGDACALPCPDASFDLVSCAFGFRNFPDRARALVEVRRVLRPGGRLLVLELFRSRNRLRGWVTSRWLGRMAPFFAGDREDDYAYLRTSIERTCSVDEFVETARQIGYSDESLTFFLPSCDCLLLRKCDTITS